MNRKNVQCPVLLILAVTWATAIGAYERTRLLTPAPFDVYLARYRRVWPQLLAGRYTA